MTVTANEYLKGVRKKQKSNNKVKNERGEVRTIKQELLQIGVEFVTKIYGSRQKTRTYSEKVKVL